VHLQTVIIPPARRGTAGTRYAAFSQIGKIDCLDKTHQCPKWLEESNKRGGLHEAINYAPEKPNYRRQSIASVRLTSASFL